MTYKGRYDTEKGCYSDLFKEVADILNSQGLKPYEMKKYTPQYVRKVMSGKITDNNVINTLQDVAKRTLAKQNP